MRVSICGRALLAGACMMASVAAWGQSKDLHVKLDAAATYNPMLANVASTSNEFWMHGGSAQFHAQFWKGLGAVADVAGLHIGKVSNQGVGLDLFTLTFGPRYTWKVHDRVDVYGQLLMGEVHGFNSIFPNASGGSSSANSFALQTGGGVNVSLTHHFSLRAFEGNWLRTQLPNAGTNVQNNFRIGSGIIYHFK